MAASRNADQSIRIYDLRTGAFLGGGTVLGWKIDEDSDALDDALDRHVNDCVEGARYDSWYATGDVTNSRGVRFLDVEVMGRPMAVVRIEAFAPVALEMAVAA